MIINFTIHSILKIASCLYQTILQHQATFHMIPNSLDSTKASSIKIPNVKRNIPLLTTLTKVPALVLLKILDNKKIKFLTLEIEFSL